MQSVFKSWVLFCKRRKNGYF